MKIIQQVSLFTLTSFLLLSCGSKAPERTTQTINHDSLEIINNTACTETLLIENGLNVISSNVEECALLEGAGDERCNLLAQYANLDDLSLEFYSQTTDQGTVCGCQCAEEINSFEDPSPCMQNIKDTLLAIESGGYENYIFTENYLLLSTVSPDYDLESSRNRCKFKDGLFNSNIEIETVLVELNNQTYLACECKDDACSADQNTDSATQYNSYGQGNQTEPYRIHNGAQLFSMSRNVNALNKDYELCKHVNLNQFYAPVSNRINFIIGSRLHPFTGSFDGRNHIISNYQYIKNGIFYSNPQQNPVYALDQVGTILRLNDKQAGLFGRVSGASIIDLNLHSIDIRLPQGEYVGGLIGEGDFAQLDNIYVEGNIETGSISGGVAGSIHVNASQLKSNVQIVGTDPNPNQEEYPDTRIGGLIGNLLSGSTLMDSYALGSVEGIFNTVGGLVGKNMSNSIIKRSYVNQSNIYADVFVGGLVGKNYGTIVDSYVHGEILGHASVGGLVGRNEGEIMRTYSLGEVICEDDAAGGIAGANNGIISDSFSNMDIIGNSPTNSFDISRIVGWTQGGSVNNVHYWQGSLCQSSDNCPINVGEIGHLNINYFFDMNNAPLNAWNFSTVWSIEAGVGYPYLNIE